MQLEQNDGDGRGEKGTRPGTARRKASHASFCFFPSHSWVSVFGEETASSIFVFSTAVPDQHIFSGTHVAPEAELGNEDSGNVHLRSPSVTGRAARFLIRAFWGSEPGWTCAPYAYRDSGDSALPPLPL